MRVDIGHVPFVERRLLGLHRDHPDQIVAQLLEDAVLLESRVERERAFALRHKRYPGVPAREILLHCGERIRGFQPWLGGDAHRAKRARGEQDGLALLHADGEGRAQHRQAVLDLLEPQESRRAAGQLPGSLRIEPKPRRRPFDPRRNESRMTGNQVAPDPLSLGRAAIVAAQIDPLAEGTVQTSRGWIHRCLPSGVTLPEFMPSRMSLPEDLLGGGVLRDFDLRRIDDKVAGWRPACRARVGPDESHRDHAQDDEGLPGLMT